MASNQELLLGVGGFGVVTLSTDKDDDKYLVAHKEIKNFDNHLFTREINSFRALDRYGFVKMIRYQDDIDHGHPAYIDMDFIPGGDLSQLLNAEASQANIPLFDITQKMIIAYGTARSLKIMHDNHFIHRDIKPDNILLDHKLRPYLTDFGLSRKIAPTQQQVTNVGTLNYMSPEILAGQNNVTNKSDVHMFGMLLYEMFNNEFPYVGLSDHAIIHNIIHGILPEIKKPSLIDDLFKKCCQLSPENRPDFEEVANEIIKIVNSSNVVSQTTFMKYKKFYDKQATLIGDDIPRCGTINFLRQAADNDIPFALYKYGTMLQNGYIVEKDESLGKEYIRRAIMLLKLEEEETTDEDYSEEDGIDIE
ncbi:hypothetical protein TRFO_07339 [Tritrichomonas foetus]|uniref:Protein kinase domain-containing protein n=1 Tax=Tritrichomonas foetus TaxID=1144522 RepID=A0A1J4JRP3_9EUKA|nr:hypothetical protein TRFO_07339 [Tritrichomonas foetus]|eukprot:OHT01793.1 hypothetical protein TRFO_07339 [Tritrichomonas foetus]